MTLSLPFLQSPPSSLAQCWHYHRDNNVSVPCEISLTKTTFLASVGSECEERTKIIESLVSLRIIFDENLESSDL